MENDDSTTTIPAAGDETQSLQSLSISPPPQPPQRIMSVEEMFSIQEDELWRLLENNPQPVAYDGFEPSGRMQIAQGDMKAINVNKLTSAGCKVKILIADWFAFSNNKMGGDLNKIKVTEQYFIEI